MSKIPPFIGAFRVLLRSVTVALLADLKVLSMEMAAPVKELDYF